ncbi:MAG TPA: hypothetical protein VK633_09525, partial [Verrucomicrobiae bacterium]|nr:hypothetical protein [Verrucomicrobiae bacterium]
IAGVDGSSSGGEYGAVMLQDFGELGSYVTLGAFNGKNGIAQTFDTEPGMRYKVSFGLYPNWFNPPFTAELLASAGSGAVTIPIVGKDAPPEPAAVPFEPFEFTFLSDSSGKSTLSFQNVSGLPSIDSVVVVLDIPEPRTIAILLSGFALFCVRARNVEITKDIKETDH